MKDLSSFKKNLSLNLIQGNIVKKVAIRFINGFKKG